MKDSSRIYKILEILCVLFWFLLDGFWLFEWEILTYIFAGIALSLALLMFACIKREAVVVLVACADVSWLLFNICWAVGDLSGTATALTMAKVLFWIGVAFCAFAFLKAEAGQKFQVMVLSRMRVLKLLSK